jgi:hypothetical protein
MSSKQLSLRRSVFFVLFAISLSMQSQQNPVGGFFYPSPLPDNRRITGLAISEGIAFTGTIFVLQYLWYKNYPRSRFHFFNDNLEWLQMDKLGHATTAYNLGVLGTDVYRWAGMSQRNAIWCGGLGGLLFLVTIEVFDGFSSGWGFSGGDMLANSAGAGLAIGQYLGWNEQRIQLKFSYHRSMYSKYRPEELGKTWAQSILKDYNGQSYWVSANIASFLPGSSPFPKWLNLALGMGAEGMISGRQTDAAAAKDAASKTAFVRERRLFISPDIDFRRIQTGEQPSAIFFKSINFIKVPAPALEFRPGIKKFRGHLLYY